MTLIARVAQHDARALEALFARHRGPMLRFATALARDAAVADDAVQDAFVAVWKGASSFRGETSPRAWMYSIARNAVFRQFRKRAGEDEVSLEELGADAGWGDQAASARVAAAIEDRDRVRHAANAIGDGDREVLWLVDVEGLTLHEAAAALDVGLPAVKSRLHRARLRFVAALAKEDGDAR